MGKIRLGIIGCGGMANRGHAKSIHKCSDVLEVTAVCDINPENAQAVADILDCGVFACADYRDLVDHVDAVLVSLPHDLHYECGMFFAENHKHILMEKPLCNTEEECLRLIETCEKNDVTLMCGYPVRYWPGILKLKELIESGDYGKAFMMSIWTEQHTRFYPLHWTRTSRSGGGQLFCHGCHYIDLLLWFFGQPAYGAHIGTNLGTEWLLKEGTSAVTIKFENGVVGYHGATWGARGTRLAADFQIHTEEGLLDYDHAEGTITFYSNEAAHDPKIPHKPTSEVIWNQGKADKMTNNEIDHFVDCILHHKTPLTSGRTALESLRVIWKLYDAEKHHTMADLRDINPNSYL